MRCLVYVRKRKSIENWLMFDMRYWHYCSHVTWNYQQFKEMVVVCLLWKIKIWWKYWMKMLIKITWSDMPVALSFIRNTWGASTYRRLLHFSSYRTGFVTRFSHVLRVVPSSNVRAKLCFSCFSICYMSYHSYCLS